MKTVGLIVEYNPLHYGHVYHFEHSRLAAGADASVAVMSGHFLQRGEPSLVDKWARAEMALRMGADVVIELPAAFAVRPAEWFAYGAISALDATGIVDAVCFGSESGDLVLLQALADAVYDESDSFKGMIAARLKKGSSYPAAYAAAVEAYTGTGGGEGKPAGPNNTLGLHYLIALRRLGSPIRPLTIERRKAGYHQLAVTDNRIASATAIRRILFEKGDLQEAASLLPPYTHEILRREWDSGRAPMDWERFASPMLHLLASLSESELARFNEVAEGLEFRLKRSLRQLDPAAGGLVGLLLEASKTRRYTRTKLQRTLLSILLGYTKESLTREIMLRGVPYLRILGFSTRGRELLKRMKRTSRVPVVTRASGMRHPFLDMDIRASSVYALGFPDPAARRLLRDYDQPPLAVDVPFGGSERK